jgi:hypothetical protein
VIETIRNIGLGLLSLVGACITVAFIAVAVFFSGAFFTVLMFGVGVVVLIAFVATGIYSSFVPEEKPPPRYEREVTPPPGTD